MKTLFKKKNKPNNLINKGKNVITDTDEMVSSRYMFELNRDMAFNNYLLVILLITDGLFLAIAAVSI
jgi:hypothetical protein